MKHLIIYSHLNPKSFTKAIVDKVEKVAKEKGDEVKIIDLYGDKFNPVLELKDIEYKIMGKAAPSDVVNYQKMIMWADHLTFVYPMWWAHMPAMLKGFIDRVFTHGFAFKYDAESGIVTGLLKGKTVSQFVMTSTSNDVYRKGGMHKAQSVVVEEATFSFCGLEDFQSTYFGSIMDTDELRKGYLDSIT